MVEYRELSEEERNICLKQKNEWIERRRKFQYLIQHYSLQISEGLPINYLEQMRKLHDDKKATAQMLYEADLHILNLEEQLTKGVLKREHQEEITLTKVSEEE